MAAINQTGVVSYNEFNTLKYALSYALIITATLLLYVFVLRFSALNTLAAHCVGKILIFGTFMFFAIRAFRNKVHSFHISQKLKMGILIGFFVAVMLTITEIALHEILGIKLAPPIGELGEGTSPYVLYILLGMEMVTYGIITSFLFNFLFRNNESVVPEVA